MGRNSIINDENPTDDILEGLYKLRIRESDMGIDHTLQLSVVLHLSTVLASSCPVVWPCVESDLIIRDTLAQVSEKESASSCLSRLS